VMEQYVSSKCWFPRTRLQNVNPEHHNISLSYIRREGKPWLPSIYVQTIANRSTPLKLTFDAWFLSVVDGESSEGGLGL
jgi:hypothetical protein